MVRWNLPIQWGLKTHISHVECNPLDETFPSFE
jgi:hypothetical protein